MLLAISPAVVYIRGIPSQVLPLMNLLALLMAIPGTALAVGFNAMFAEDVPAEWRAHVAGIRNVVLSVVFVVTSLVCGAILDGLPFPIGYQVVFAIGFIGAAMSSYHIFHIRPLGAANPLPAASAAEPRPRRTRSLRPFPLFFLAQALDGPPYALAGAFAAGIDLEGTFQVLDTAARTGNGGQE